MRVGADRHRTPTASSSGLPRASLNWGTGQRRRGEHFIVYRILLNSEVEAASELARRVFDEFIAPLYSVEGREELYL